MFDIKRLLDTNLGHIFISVLLGLGLATLFRKVCNDKQCMSFNGPILHTVNGKIYQFDDDNCYKYNLVKTKNDTSKKTIELEATHDENGVAIPDALPSWNPFATTKE
jgi:hypothetical protein